MQEALPEIMTVKEAADYLKVSPQTIRNLADENLIDYIRVGIQYRIVRDSLIESLKKTYCGKTN
jgi:excisionase family DNA binding protein